MGGKDSDDVTFVYVVYDLAANYWHTWNVQETLSKISKRELAYWMAYRQKRIELEKKQMDRASKK